MFENITLYFCQHKYVIILLCSLITLSCDYLLSNYSDYVICVILTWNIIFLREKKGSNAYDRIHTHSQCTPIYQLVYPPSFILTHSFISVERYLDMFLCVFYLFSPDISLWSCLHSSVCSCTMAVLCTVYTWPSVPYSLFFSLS